MATYEEIYGKRVKEFDSDPTLDSSYEGQVWYDKSSGTLRSVVSFGAWSSGSPLATARFSLAGAGTQTAALAFGGKEPSVSNKTEEYNGSGWSTGGNLGTAVYILGGAGSQTAGLGFGGYRPGNTNATEEYNGSSWTASNTMGTARRSLMGAGIQTAALGAGGNSTTTNVNLTEEYDGTSWTAVNTMGTGRAELGGSGLQTAALAVGAGSPNAQVEEYDGTNWSTGGDLNTGRSIATATGPQTANLAFGPSADCEAYDGTSWTAQPDMGTSRGSMGGGMQSPNTASIGFGGSPGAKADTEEFTNSINVITAGAFSSLPTLNSARWGAGAAGTKAAGIVFGGRNPSISTDLALSEEYNGSSWSEGPDLGQARRVMGRGTGTQTAALAHGGHYSSPSTRYKVAEEYDGSSWTNGGTSTNAHDGTMQIGTQTAAASCGGYDGTNMNETEEYNGTSFSSANTMTYSAYMGAAAGPQTAAVVFAGGFPAVNNSNEYDGTNWTSGNTTLKTNYGIAGNGGNGSQTEAIGAGGYTPGPVYFSSVETYDGTTFATAPSLGTARSELPSAGPNSSFFVAGGLLSTGSGSNLVEEFTPESSVITAKTLTSS
jgi:hypothetical protein